MKTKEFIQTLDDAAIARAISEAEKRTSGEIRVYVSDGVVDDVLAAAEKQFAALGMTKTKERNGVLIYFAPKCQKYAVVGDQAVHAKCGTKFWQHIADEMSPLLKSRRFTDAISLAVNEIGEVLAREFPWTRGDKNELPNQVARDPKI